MKMPHKFTTVTAAILASGCGIFVGNPGKGGKGEPEGPMPTATPEAVVQTNCGKDQVPSVGDATGQFVFEVDDSIDPCSVTGYMVGQQKLFPVVAAAGGKFYIDKIPAGSSDFIIRGKPKAATVALDGDTPPNGIRLNAVQMFAGKQVDQGVVTLPINGSISGKAILSGQSNSAGIDIYIPGTDMAAKSADDGSFTILNVPSGIYNLYFDYSGYHRGQIEQLNVKSGDATAVDQVDLVLDTGAEGFITLAGGAAAYGSRTVPVVIGATNDAVLMKISESSDFVGASWKPLNTTTTYTFADEGDVTLYVKFANANGLESSPYSASLLISAYKFSLAFGSHGSGNGQLAFPYGISLDPNGNIVVLEGDNCRVQKFDPKGQYILKFGTCGSGDGQFGTEGGLATDSSGNIYTVDPYASRVQKFDSSGNFLTKFGTSGSADGQFDGSRGIALDPASNIYVSDMNNFRVEKFSSSGSFVGKIALNTDGHAGYSWGVAVDKDGNVYIADHTDSVVRKFSASGNLLLEIGEQGSGNGQFKNPRGVMIDSKGNIFVADSNNNRIQEFDSSGKFLHKFGSAGSSDGQFNFPTSLTMDAAGNIYVADTVNNRIQIFTPTN